MSHESLLLENQLCFLVYRLNRSIGDAYRPLLEGLGLTYPQYLVMLALWERKILSIGELCRLLDLDTGTVSPLIKRMEALGLVRRERRPDDERSVSVALTEKGAELEARAVSIPEKMGSCLLERESEYAPLKATLKTLVDRVERACEREREKPR